MVHRVPKASMCLVFNKRKYAKLVHGKHLSPSKKTFSVQSKAIFVLSRERERERERTFVSKYVEGKHALSC